MISATQKQYGISVRARTNPAPNFVAASSGELWARAYFAESSTERENKALFAEPPIFTNKFCLDFAHFSAYSNLFFRFKFSPGTSFPRRRVYLVAYLKHEERRANGSAIDKPTRMNQSSARPEPALR